MFEIWHAVNKIYLPAGVFLSYLKYTVVDYVTGHCKQDWVFRLNDNTLIALSIKIYIYIKHMG